MRGPTLSWTRVPPRSSPRWSSGSFTELTIAAAWAAHGPARRTAAMTFLYLVRHGETDWNRERRIQGSTAIPLNETGRLQAARTGRLLSRRRWDGILTSAL